MHGSTSKKKNIASDEMDDSDNSSSCDSSSDEERRPLSYRTPFLTQACPFFKIIITINYLVLKLLSLYIY